MGHRNLRGIQSDLRKGCEGVGRRAVRYACVPSVQRCGAANEKGGGD